MEGRWKPRGSRWVMREAIIPIRAILAMGFNRECGRPPLGQGVCNLHKVTDLYMKVLMYTKGAD